MEKQPRSHKRDKLVKQLSRILFTPLPPFIFVLFNSCTNDFNKLKNSLESPNGFIQPHILDIILKADNFTSAGKCGGQISLNCKIGCNAFSLYKALGNVRENISSVLMHSSAKSLAVWSGLLRLTFKPSKYAPMIFCDNNIRKHCLLWSIFKNCLIARQHNTGVSARICTGRFKILHNAGKNSDGGYFSTMPKSIARNNTSFNCSNI